MKTKLRLVFSITIFLIGFCAFAQENYWEEQPGFHPADSQSAMITKSGNQRIYILDFDKLKTRIAPAVQGRVQSEVFLPVTNGEIRRFTVRETPVLAPELSAKYPEIKSYTGISGDGSGIRLRMSVSHKGIAAMMVDTGKGEISFIQRLRNSGQVYAIYDRDPQAEEVAGFLCKTENRSKYRKEPSSSKLVDDQILRKYRLAVSATGEYTQYHGGTVADALAAINTTITRVNEVMETDLAITLEIVPDNDLVIFTDPSTDPYGGNLNAEVQNELTATIGELNYDIGHLFENANNSGNAGFIGAVCVDNQKGSAFSSAITPEGDTFDLDFVAHEMGHQFGANHTWSFESEGTQVQAEPGSGSTIMGYAGITGDNNVAPNGDDYYHYFSILQITQYIQGTSCAEEIPLANNPPVITAIPDYSIPKGTAFVLSAAVTDPDPGDVLTYAWEQIDDGVVSNTTFGPDQPSGANFRSLPPSTDPARYFPKLAEVAQGNLTQTNPTINTAWETVSNVQRDLNFALTVRDNATGGGQVASELVTINVFNTAGPFEITSQASPETYEAGSVQTVNWDVADTDKNPINAQLVDIFLSLDGGLSFPILLAGGTPNDGSEEIQIPGNPTTQGRIMVMASNNVFFAVNTADITILDSDVVLQMPGLDFEVCQPNDAVIGFTYETNGGFSETSTFSVSGLPPGLTAVFAPVSASADNTPVTLTISNTAGVATGQYDLVLEASSVSNAESVPFTLSIGDTSFGDVVLIDPIDNATSVSLQQEFSWQDDPLYTSYDIQVATDPGFTAIIETANVLINSYAPQNLLPDTTYYWRVRPNNFCGSGTFGSAFSFTTTTLNCKSVSATGLPLTISSSGTPTITSTVSFINDLTISDVNLDLNIDHTFLADLVIKLRSPMGTEVTLLANSCGNLRDINALFDDDAAPFVCSGTPGISGTVQPVGSLATFNGESTLGTWTLIVEDTAPADGGALNSFTLELCVEGSFRPDDDGDGVFDDGDDLCLGTPPGTEVDTDGCPVYRFDPDNFIVELLSESCRNNNDGEILITAEDFLDYTLTVTGNDVDITDTFNDKYTVSNLAAGTYDVCISGTSGTIDYEEQCFEVVISQPEPLSVFSTLDARGKRIILELSGAGEYTITVNDKTLRTRSSRVELPLENGDNTVFVRTELECQGNFRETYFISDKPVLFPNPFSSEINAFLGTVDSPVRIRVYTYHGKLVKETTVQDTGQQVVLDVLALPAGMYFVQIEGGGITSTSKVIKQ